MGCKTIYDPSFCEAIIKFRAQGYSNRAFCGEYGISEDAFYRWTKKYPEFGEAVKLAELKCQKVYEDIGRRLMKGELRGNAAVFIFMTANMFGFRRGDPDSQKSIEHDGYVFVEEKKKEGDGNAS